MAPASLEVKADQQWAEIQDGAPPWLRGLLEEQQRVLLREMSVFMLSRFEEHKMTVLYRIGVETNFFDLTNPWTTAPLEREDVVQTESCLACGGLGCSLCPLAAGPASPKRDCRPQAKGARPPEGCLACGSLGCGLCMASAIPKDVQNAGVRNGGVKNGGSCPACGIMGCGGSCAKDGAGGRGPTMPGNTQGDTAASPPEKTVLKHACSVIKDWTKFLPSAEKKLKEFNEFAHHHHSLKNSLAKVRQGVQDAANDEVEMVKASSTMHQDKLYKTGALREIAGQTHVRGESFVQMIIHSNRFEIITSSLIVACAIVMAMEVEYEGKEIGYKLGAVGFYEPGHVVWPGFTHLRKSCELFFTLVFTVELLLRAAALRLKMFGCAWTWLDGVLVLFAWLDQLAMLVMPLDPKLLRVARLARIARLVKMLKAMRAFDTLVLLLHAVKASVSCMIWCYLLLVFILSSTAIMTSQMLQDYVEDEDNPREVREQIFTLFGTFINAMVTMFEISMGNWVVPCRLLYLHVNRWWGVFFMIFRCCFIFATMKVIAAVFIAETTRCLARDDSIAIAKAQNDKETFCRKLNEIFQELDDSGDRTLDWDEFRLLTTDDLLRSWLASLQIDTWDLAELFNLLDQGDGNIDIKEFTYGMTRVKGPAKSIDVLKLQATVNRLMLSVDRLERGARQPEQRDPQPRQRDEATLDAEAGTVTSMEIWKATAGLNLKIDRLAQALHSINLGEAPRHCQATSSSFLAPPPPLHGAIAL